MAWDSNSLKEAFDYIKKGPKASRLGSALGEIAGDSQDTNYERLCPHCYDILEVDKSYPIWGCLNCTKSFIATDNISNELRVAIATLALFGVVSKIAIRDGMVAGVESKKITQKLLEFCSDDTQKSYQKKIQKIANNDKYSLDYFSELLFASFEGKEYRDYREVLYRALFELISSDGKLFSYEMDLLKEIEGLMKFDYSFYDYLYLELINSVDKKSLLRVFRVDEKDIEPFKEKLDNKLALYEDEKLDSLHFSNILKEFAKREKSSLERLKETLLN